MSQTRDVYAAEDLFASWLDQASRSPGTPVRVRLGSTEQAFEPETEPRFTDPAHVQDYVDRVMAHLIAIQARYDDGQGLDLATVPVRVRARRGQRKAHYERSGSPHHAVIALPPRERGGAWSLRAAVVLHEVAHHLSVNGDHDGSFRTTFLRLLEDLGLPVQADLLHAAYRAQGLDSDLDADRTLVRIGRLLRQAERSSNTAEREAFFTKAQTLATRHQIALAVARATAHGEEQRRDPTWETVLIGDQGKRSLARYVRLIIDIAQANDVRVAIQPSNTRVTLYGFPADIAVVKALYATLVTQMVADGDAHLRSGAHKSDLREAWDEREQRWVQRPVHGSTARAAFYDAWSRHIASRLSEARASARAAAVAKTAAESATPTEPTSTELALRAKEVEMVDYYQRMQHEHHIRGSWRGAASAGNAAPGSRRAGVKAAARASLGTEKALG
ncbi:MAG: TIGR04338 family metallohydrolase [Nocardioidaceae bacterium]|nr:TIGR04338 family metallohydrolase [Nocardioidaceae bacterium]